MIHAAGDWQGTTVAPTCTSSTVGNIAINDAVTIEALVFKVLKRHFANDACYLQLVDLMMETTFQTECGQLLDTLCMNLTLEDFSVDRYVGRPPPSGSYAPSHPRRWSRPC